MRISYILIPLFLIFSFACGMLISILNNRLIDFSVLEYKAGKPSILLDDEGNEWARFEQDRREAIKFEQIPDHLIKAFIATEDRNFFNHSGLSWKGIARSIMVNIYKGKRSQGASTITQQLVRLLFFDSKKTFIRKIKEQFLELYLNNIYFGCGIYGVQAASLRFFGKTANQISIGEAAVLAGVVKSPFNYCPLLSPLASQKRRDLILSLMRDMKFITGDEMKTERGINLKIKDNENKNLAPHLKETLRLFLEDKFGKQKLYSGGLQIQTTINRKTQIIAQREFDKQFVLIKKEIHKNMDGALISMETSTGEIKAIIGGVDFLNSKYNRALQAKRQMGSIFKPIVYAAALNKGISFSDTEIDEPLEFGTGPVKWKPNNNTGDFRGQMTLAKALCFSNNIIAIKTLLKVGCPDVVSLAKKFRFSSQINPYLSLALGCVDVTLKEAVASFNVFTNDGVYVEPYFIKWVKDQWGTKLWKFQPDEERIINSNVNSQVVRVLSLGIKRYYERTGGKIFKAQAMGKTGTTNDSRTCWFSGATPGLTTCIYVGCDNNESMGNCIYPVTTAFPIWMSLYNQLNFPNRDFTVNSSLREISINWNTGQLNYNFTDPDTVSILVN